MAKAHACTFAIVRAFTLSRAEHIAPASFGSADEASSGCGDMSINSLDDVVSMLSSDCDESAAPLRNAVQTLQRGVQAEMRNICYAPGNAITSPVRQDRTGQDTTEQEGQETARKQTQQNKTNKASAL